MKILAKGPFHKNIFLLVEPASLYFPWIRNILRLNEKNSPFIALPVQLALLSVLFCKQILK